METGCTLIKNEEYKTLILDNDRLQRELDLSLVAEIEANKKANDLKEQLFKLLNIAVDDVSFDMGVRYYNINTGILAEYLNDNYLNDIKHIIEVRNQAEKKEDETNEYSE